MRFGEGPFWKIHRTYGTSVMMIVSHTKLKVTTTPKVLISTPMTSQRSFVFRSKKTLVCILLLSETSVLPIVTTVGIFYTIL